MLRTYKYITTSHHKLHQYVMDFFVKIEYETGEFRDVFFDTHFYQNIVYHHPRILEKRFKAIYNEMRKWNQSERSDFCKKIKQSNKIEDICKGEIIPMKDTDIPASIRDTTKELFKTLYEDILKGSGYFKAKHGSLLQHFREFKQRPNDFIKCPACGIRDVETIYDDERDQYDHYLPLSIYPFSSINFQNLVPVCTKCNSLEVKSNTDILAKTGVVFYPYDETHTGIDIQIKIIKDDVVIGNVDFKIDYSNINVENEKKVRAWKQIYKLEERHKKFIKGRIEKWYRAYWTFMNDSELAFLAEDVRKLCCFKSLEKDESIELGFIRKPALEAFLRDSVMAQAQLETVNYSLY